MKHFRLNWWLQPYQCDLLLYQKHHTSRLNLDLCPLTLLIIHEKERTISTFPFLYKNACLQCVELLSHATVSMTKMGVVFSYNTHVPVTASVSKCIFCFHDSLNRQSAWKHFGLSTCESAISLFPWGALGYRRSLSCTAWTGTECCSKLRSISQKAQSKDWLNISTI